MKTISIEKPSGTFFKTCEPQNRTVYWLLLLGIDGEIKITNKNLPIPAPPASKSFKNSLAWPLVNFLGNSVGICSPSIISDPRPLWNDGGLHCWLILLMGFGCDHGDKCEEAVKTVHLANFLGIFLLVESCWRVKWFWGFPKDGSAYIGDQV